MRTDEIELREAVWTAVHHPDVRDRRMAVFLATTSALRLARGRPQIARRRFLDAMAQAEGKAPWVISAERPRIRG